MRSWSIPIGRLFGVDVRIHLTFIILPLFIFWTEYAAHQGSANGSRDLALAGIVLACVAAHEFGHILVARRMGLVPKAVILLPLTGVTIYDESRIEKPQPAALWNRELRLALVGPFVSLVLAVAAGAVIALTMPAVELWQWPFLTARNLPRSILWANLYLAVLNLMPAYPLDGGRILRAYFSRTLDASSATRRAVSISNAIAMVLMLAGLFSDSWLTMVGDRKSVV